MNKATIYKIYDLNYFLYLVTCDKVKMNVNLYIILSLKSLIYFLKLQESKSNLVKLTEYIKLFFFFMCVTILVWVKIKIVWSITDYSDKVSMENSYLILLLYHKSSLEV